MMTTKLTAEHLKILTAKFPDDRLGVKLQSQNKEKTWGMLVLYLQHTDVMDRLESVDPAWSNRVIAIEPAGNMLNIRMELSLLGVTRENVGEGEDHKSAYSDALKRCAMSFGVGRYLYDEEKVWVKTEPNDRNRVWTMEDYRAAAKSKGAPAAPPANSGVGLVNAQTLPQAPARPTPRLAPAPAQGFAQALAQLNQDEDVPPFDQDGPALSMIHTVPFAEYECPFGKNKGKKLREVLDQELHESVAHWNTVYQKEGKLSPKALEFVNNATAYLKARAGA